MQQYSRAQGGEISVTMQLLLSLVVSFTLFVCIQLVLASEQSLDSSGEELITVREPSEWNFTIDCDPYETSSLCDSLTLDQIAENVTETAHVYIEIKISLLQLKGRVRFENYMSLNIAGTYVTISCTERDSGLVVFNVTDVTISGIKLTNCSTHDFNSIYYYTVSLHHCMDITIINVTFVENNATALSIRDHQGGTVKISSSDFIDNIVTSTGEDVYGQGIRGGGGIFIGNYGSDPSSPGMYYFENCLFHRNVAHTRFYNFEYTDELGQPISGYGRGGGVFLAFETPPALTDIHAEFSDCKFVENAGFLGGGLSVDIEGDKERETMNITVIIRNSVFEENGCSLESPTGSGGGAHFDFNTFNKQLLSQGHIRVINVNFSNNCAEIGGGVYFFSAHREASADLNELLFENCTFIANEAHTGAAVDLTPNIFDRLTSGFLLIPKIEDCRFLLNVNIRSLNTETTFGTGTIYSSQYSLNFVGNTQFLNNSGTALYIVNGLADFSNGSVIFKHNNGNRGGAVALIGLSSFLVGTEGHYLFHKNIAMDRGGAIYSLMTDNHDYTISRSCFIQYVDCKNRNRIIPAYEWKANITFHGNRAKSGKGNAIFATSLYPCQVINNGSNAYVVVDISNALSVRSITFDDDPQLQPQTSTEGAVLDHNNQLPLQIIPGELFTHGVTLADDLHNPVNATFQASISGNPSVRVDSAFSSCLSDEIKLKGEPNQAAHLFLQTISPRQTYVKLDVKLTNCPPGFVLEENTCVCNAHLITGFLRCDTNTSNSYILRDYWTGLVHLKDDPSRMELAIGICPPFFCDYNETDITSAGIKLPQNTSLLNEAICGMSRMGTLCGDCNTGYTTHFHSPSFSCKPVKPGLCKVGWLFYILSELVPVTVTFVTVLVFNISFTSGAVNGFILFSQLINSLDINADGLISLSNSTLVFVRGYRVIYGFFNLDYFDVDTLSFCLWTSASALDMIAFKYVTVAYALLLMIVVVCFMNKCGGRCLGKWWRITKLNSSVIHGMTTFLVICYAQCIYVSITLLLRYCYTPQAGSRLAPINVVWLNGNLDFFSRKHLPYALPALFCMLTIGVLPPFFLLIYPLAFKVLAFFGLEDTIPVKFVSNRLPVGILKPLLDSFQGCFKDNLRFFAGLYFIYRWIGLAVDAFTSSNSTFFTTVEIILLIVLSLHAVCQPYIDKVHNIMDTMLFSNLAIINAISFANYHRARNYHRNKSLYSRTMNLSIAIQLVLIYLPVTIMVIYVIVKCYRFKYQKREINSDESHTTFKRFQKLRSLVSVDTVNDEEELPHRLIASLSEYRTFNENDHNFSTMRDAELNFTY